VPGQHRGCRSVPGKRRGPDQTAITSKTSKERGAGAYQGGTAATLPIYLNWSALCSVLAGLRGLLPRLRPTPSGAPRGAVALVRGADVTGLALVQARTSAGQR
jgi:hypothetical protein